MSKIINNIFFQTKDIIIQLIDTNKKGEQKKAILDDKISGQLIVLFSEYLKTKNPILLLVKKIALDYLLANVPAITQGIFNMIKTRVEGITDAK